MGLVKTRRLAAMRKQQRAKAGMKPPVPKQARKCAPFPPQSSKPLHTKTFPPNLWVHSLQNKVPQEAGDLV